ncbi:hypothetical protein C4Z35_006310 [Klebsiella pneumoniae subsp. pneumoniae]|nr:hypothetical protein C4Z35_006310 [Klebsiella pneumoniae subsp. pneumoniae]HBU0299448.1 hypothetical protein [Klebsiella pneumoniae]
MVTQSLADFGRYSYKPRPAFQDWIERLKTGERLPRGRYFVGKKPGGRLVLIDELGGTWTEKVTVIHTNAGWGRLRKRNLWSLPFLQHRF